MVNAIREVFINFKYQAVTDWKITWVVVSSSSVWKGVPNLLKNSLKGQEKQDREWEEMKKQNQF